MATVMNPQNIQQQIMQQMLTMQGQDAVPPKTEEELKRQRIRDALATAGKTLSTTPGNALQGVSAALGSAAEAYQGTRKEQDKTSQNVSERNQARQLQIMRSILGGANSMASGQRADAAAARAARAEQRALEDRDYNRERQEKLDTQSEEDRQFERDRQRMLDDRQSEIDEQTYADRQAERDRLAEQDRIAAEQRDAETARQAEQDRIAAETRKYERQREERQDRQSLLNTQADNLRQSNKNAAQKQMDIERLLNKRYELMQEVVTDDLATDEDKQQARIDYENYRKRLQAPDSPGAKRQTNTAPAARQPIYGSTRKGPNGQKQVYDGTKWVNYP